MGALKPRDVHGDLDVYREARHVVVRIPTGPGAERLVFTISEQEARDLATRLVKATSDDPLVSRASDRSAT